MSTKAQRLAILQAQLAAAQNDLQAQLAAAQNESEDEDEDMKAAVHTPSDDEDEPSPVMLQAQQDRADDEANVAKTKAKFHTAEPKNRKRNRRVIDDDDDDDDEEKPQKKKQHPGKRFCDTESVECDGDDTEVEEEDCELDEHGYAVETVVKKSLVKLENKSTPATAPSFVQANAVVKPGKVHVITTLALKAKFYSGSQSKPIVVVHVGDAPVPMTTVMKGDGGRVAAIDVKAASPMHFVTTRIERLKDGKGMYDVYLLNPDNIGADPIRVIRDVAREIMSRELTNFPDRYNERVLSALTHNNLLHGKDGVRHMFLPQSYWTIIHNRYTGKTVEEVAKLLTNRTRVVKPKAPTTVKKEPVETEEPTVIIPPTPKDFVFDENLCESATEFMLSVLSAGYNDAAFNATAGKWLGFGNNGQGCVYSIIHGPPETAIDRMNSTYKNDIPRFLMHWMPYLLSRGKEMLEYKIHEDRAKTFPSPFDTAPFPL